MGIRHDIQDMVQAISPFKILEKPRMKQMEGSGLWEVEAFAIHKETGRSTMLRLYANGDRRKVGAALKHLTTKDRWQTL
jgi:hypothetical protein